MTRAERRASERRGVVLLGKPASGKGTQGRILGAVPGFLHVETGAVLRSLAGGDTRLGRQVRQFLDKGELVPDERMVEIFARHLEQLERRGVYEPPADLLVLDGIPRTTAQARMLEDAAVAVTLVVHLRCDDDEALLARMRGRARSESRRDDEEAAMRTRLRAYARETARLLEYYPQPVRAETDALAHPLVVHDRIVHFVLPVAVPPDGERHG